jgi:hypothetical protein
MAETSNSFATILADFIRLQNNSLEQLQKVSQAVTTNADTVTVTQTNSDGTTSTFTLPSFGFLKSSIERIDKTVSTMLGFDGSEAYIRMPDGTFKKIYQSKNVTDPSPVGQVTVPAKFIAENNYFFESLLSPALKVSIDVSKYVPQEESKIYVKRMILSLDTDDKIQYFNNSLKGKNDINYVNLLVELQKRNITYFVDEGVNDLPLSIVRYTGDFITVNIEDRTYSNPDGSTSTKRWYLLNTLKYNDNLSLTKDTMVLKPGDKLLKGESIYEVSEIDNSTNFIRINRTSGYDPLVVGEPVIFYSETFSPKVANVGIGYDEYEVVFFKSVNDTENLLSSTYSPGVAFYTNELTIDLTTGPKLLSDFYNESVLDFGSMLLAGSKENKIAAVNGLVPNAPVLNEVNFKVVSVNDHKLDQAEIQAIRKKQADKVRLESEITELQKSIDKKKEELNTTKFNSDTERRAVKNQLDSLIREKDTKTALYASIVKELAVTAQQKPAALDTPKYRIRGFYAIPEPVKDSNGQEQNVIQFYTYYRYVRPDGSASDIKQFDYTDTSGAIKRATYSNLNEVKSEIRKKVYDPVRGIYVWLEEDITNPDVVNINQVDIPISNGEKVEFYVVSVSEAGWPENPILSVPSNIISITFPQDLVSEDEATIALREASQDIVRVDLENDLAAKGLDVHLASSFNAIEKYYAHDTSVISSNVYTAQGTVISLEDYITSLNLRIQDLENRLNKVVGDVKVYIVDEEKNAKLPVKNGDVVTLFAGYYTDAVNLLPATSRRGAIINKSYKIYLENEEASPLQLISRLPGGIAEELPDSFSSSVPPGINDPDYNLYRKYDITPIVNPSVNPADTNNANKIATAFYQSGQLKGQFLYSRYTDVGLVNPLYQAPGTGTNRYIVPSTDYSSNVTQPWIWNRLSVGPGTGPIGGGTANNFTIHIDHPAINPPAAGTTATLANLQTPVIAIDPISGNPQSPERVSTFRHAYGFNQLGDKNTPAKQLEYKKNWPSSTGPTGPYTGLTATTPTLGILPDKYGFVNDDRYLIGADTCGAYLFLGPVTYNQLLVNGVNALASRSLENGSNNAIVIPVIFQYRMTDYYGPSITSSSSAGGNGIIGGYNVTNTVPPKNITYVRQIGLDLYQQDKQTFSFDIQVAATYQKDSLIQLYETGLPTATKQVKEVTYDKATIKRIFS